MYENLFKSNSSATLSAPTYQIVRWKSRRGLHDESKAGGSANRTRKQLHAACRGQCELDLIGYDGDTLAFVEVRTRTVGDHLTALPELSVTAEKQRVVARTTQRFLAERNIKDTQLRFEVLAIDNFRGSPPKVRLHKDAFSPQI